MEILEATTGFEPVNGGFANPCLTTWLRRPLKPAKSASLPRGFYLVGAEDEIRTRDLLLGKEAFYR